MAVTLRRDKGSALTHDQLDDNFALEANQATHGYSVGQFVYWDSGGTWELAEADATTPVFADGVVVDVEDANNFSVATLDGTIVTVSTHGWGSAATELYLSQSTPGDPVSTMPTSGMIQPLGKVIDADTILFRLGFTSEES